MIEIVYWSGTGNTEAMAFEIEAAIKAVGGTVEVKTFEKTTVGAVAAHDVIIMGCPAMGEEALEETIVRPFFDDLKPKLSGKKVGLFGSYGWGDGEWIDSWAKEVVEAGATLITPLAIVNGLPDGNKDCVDLGRVATIV